MRASTTPFDRVTPQSVIERTERRRDEDQSRADEIPRLPYNAVPDRLTWTVLMAISPRGLGDGELAVPTEAMFHSGVVFDFHEEETTS